MKYKFHNDIWQWITMPVVFYGLFRSILDANAVVLHRLNMSDEAHFHFSGYVNEQKCQYWCNKQQHSVFKSLYTVQKSQFGAVSDFRITGPHIYEEGNCTVTITSA
jgi:hypothetical protein